MLHSICMYRARGLEFGWGLSYITSPQKEGVKNAPNLGTNSIDNADRGGVGLKITKLCNVVYGSPLGRAAAFTGVPSGPCRRPPCSRL